MWKYTNIFESYNIEEVEETHDRLSPEGLRHIEEDEKENAEEDND